MFATTSSYDNHRHGCRAPVHRVSNLRLNPGRKTFLANVSHGLSMPSSAYRWELFARRNAATRCEIRHLHDCIQTKSYHQRRRTIHSEAGTRREAKLVTREQLSQAHGRSRRYQWQIAQASRVCRYMLTPERFTELSELIVTSAQEVTLERTAQLDKRLSDPTKYLQERITKLCISTNHVKRSKEIRQSEAARIQLEISKAQPRRDWNPPQRSKDPHVKCR